jgi:hypothetical protein
MSDFDLVGGEVSPLSAGFQMDGLKQLLQSALDSGMTQVAISPVALSELS